MFQGIRLDYRCHSFFHLNSFQNNLELFVVKICSDIFF